MLTNTVTFSVSGFVAQGSPDLILKALAEDNHKKTLRELKNPLPVVSDSQKLDQFMESLATNNSHLSGVMDENGVLVGVVSMEDLFETILGMEIVDESDSVEDLQVLARKKWEERANGNKGGRIIVIKSHLFYRLKIDN